MQLKVGDKVKIIHFPNLTLVGEIGIILEVCPPNSKFKYRIKPNTSSWVAVMEREIEPYPRKGQQLLFSFMLIDATEST